MNDKEALQSDIFFDSECPMHLNRVALDPFTSDKNKRGAK